MKALRDPACFVLLALAGGCGEVETLGQRIYQDGVGIEGRLAYLDTL